MEGAAAGQERDLPDINFHSSPCIWFHYFCDYFYYYYGIAFPLLRPLHLISCLMVINSFRFVPAAAAISLTLLRTAIVSSCNNIIK